MPLGKFYRLGILELLFIACFYLCEYLTSPILPPSSRNEISTFSGSTITPESSNSSNKRRVRFLSPLVTQVGESHRVLPMERHHFYYSRENIMWFKHEYEAEKYPLCGVYDSIKSAIEYCRFLFFAKQQTEGDSLLEENNSVL